MLSRPARSSRVIVVFGSINLDLVFRTALLPREGETVLTDGFETTPGGKGANQAVAAARARPAGAAGRVAMVGAVGRDAFAEAALAHLAAAGVDLAGLLRSPRPTGLAAIVVDRHGRNQITVASGANLDLTGDLLPAGYLAPGTVLVLQNEVSEAANLAVARRAKAAGARVVLNAAPARPMAEDWAGLLDVLVLNEAEAEAIGGAADPDAATGLARRLDAATVVTLGAAGAVALTPDGVGLRIGALPLDRVVDTTAAGDSFVGALAAALEEGRDLAAALHFASVAGGLACTRPGAQASAPDRAAIERHLAALAPAARIDGMG
jgi:ribokinase